MRIAHLQDYGFGNLGASFKIPDSVDKYIGDSAEDESVKEYGGIYNDPKAQAYVDKIGQDLVKNSKRPNFGYKFGIVNSETPNAFALPNGSLYITIGLLRLLKNDSELANVMGHEVSHVTQRHTIKQMQVKAGTLVFTNLVGLFLRGEGSEEAKQLVSDLIVNGYSREDENEADLVGQGLAAKVKWDPKGMVGVMQIFEGLEKAHPSGVEEYMRSHPYSSERVKSATARIPSYTVPTGGWNVGDKEYANFFTGVLKPPAAPASSVARFASQSLSPLANFGEWDWKKIAGASLIGIGALAIIYMVATRD